MQGGGSSTDRLDQRAHFLGRERLLDAGLIEAREEVGVCGIQRVAGHENHARGDPGPACPDGIEQLRTHLKDCMGFVGADAGTISARRRHLDALARAQRHLQQAATQLIEHRAGELMAEELRQAQHALGEITGEFSSDDLLGKIFSSFCIGK